MSKRNYNVFFNTHTVSGIIISVGLYIIFFAGSFSFFKEEIDIWQKGNEVNHQKITEIDYDKIIKKLDDKYSLLGRDVDIHFNKNRDVLGVYLDETKDTIINPKGKKSLSFRLNLNDFSTKTYSERYSLANFLYRLHFLDPFVYPIGRYLSGFIALFFVFAIITGTIIHWKKIIPNFYRFNPKAIFRKIWTDAHTALGVIGLPFQFMYGITGLFFILSILALLPASILYNNDTTKLMEEMRPRLKVYEWQEKSDNKALAINPFLKKTDSLWEDFHIEKLSISNFGGTNMQYIISGELDTKKRFVGAGRINYNAYSSEVLFEKNPNKLNYLEDFQIVWGRFHFATFGGITLKIIYFILGMLTCFVIITGVLIWISSRDNKSRTLKQRKYTQNVGYIYLAICLSMLPVTALTFIFARITNGMFAYPKSAFYWFYFVVWGVFVLFYRLKKNNTYTNKSTLLLGSIFGFLVPIINGVTSGNWFWKTYANGQYEIFTIDLFWIVISAFSLLAFYLIKTKREK